MAQDRYTKARETRSNPFRRTRRANGSARYLSKRQAEMHRSAFDRAGNPTGLLPMNTTQSCDKGDET